MNWFHVLAMFSLWALCMARSRLATSGVGGAGPASPPSAFVRSGSGHSGRSSSNAWPCRSRRGAGGPLSPWGWKKTRNRTFCGDSSRLRRAFFPSCRSRSSVRSWNRNSYKPPPSELAYWGPEHAQERAALLEETVHGRAQGVGGNGIEFLEPTLDGRITTRVQIECEPVGPRWHAGELPRDHQVARRRRRTSRDHKSDNPASVTLL